MGSKKQNNSIVSALHFPLWRGVHVHYGWPAASIQALAWFYRLGGTFAILAELASIDELRFIL